MRGNKLQALVCGGGWGWGGRGGRGGEDKKA